MGQAAMEQPTEVKVHELELQDPDTGRFYVGELYAALIVDTEEPEERMVFRRPAGGFVVYLVDESRYVEFDDLDDLGRWSEPLYVKAALALGEEPRASI